MIKIFPKARICAIDVYADFVKALNEATKFINLYNISPSSADGKRLLVSYCLKAFSEKFKNTQSNFPKVIFLNSTSVAPKLNYFVEQILTPAIKKTTLPFCGKINSSSPELENLAEHVLANCQTSKKEEAFKKHVLRLNIR